MAKETISIKIEEETKLFPPKAIVKNYNKAAKTYNSHNAITSEIAKRLADCLLDSKHKFKHVLDLGAGTGILEKIITAQQKPELFVSSDISNGMLNQASGLKVLLNAEETLPFKEESFDLVISNLMIPWINDLPKCLHVAGRTLKKDGLFLASTLGAESFREFKFAFEQANLGAEHAIPLPNIQSIGAVLQRRGYALPVLDKDIIVLSYPNFETMYEEIKALGARNLNPSRSKSLISKAAWKKMESIYAKNFTLNDGSLQLTLEVIYMHGLRPSKGQQKALKPGSAKNSLLTALDGKS